MPDVPYLSALTRAQSGKTDVWPVRLQAPLPTVPVPLRRPDDDVSLNLGHVLREVYDEAAYELSIDDRQAPPPPALPADTQTWMRTLLDRAAGAAE